MGELRSSDGLTRPSHSEALGRENVCDALLDGVKSASLGQISAALYEVGGEYRRNM